VMIEGKMTCRNVDRKMSTMKTSTVKMSTEKRRQAECRQIQMSTDTNVDKQNVETDCRKQNVDTASCKISSINFENDMVKESSSCPNIIINCHC